MAPRPLDGRGLPPEAQFTLPPVDAPPLAGDLVPLNQFHASYTFNVAGVGLCTVFRVPPNDAVTAAQCVELIAEDDNFAGSERQYTLQRMLLQADSLHTMSMALSDWEGDLLACIIVRISRRCAAPSYWAQVLTHVVRRDVRRRGLGRVLWHACRDELTTNFGVDGACLYAAPEAREFWRKVGFSGDHVAEVLPDEDVKQAAADGRLDRYGGRRLLPEVQIELDENGKEAHRPLDLWVCSLLEDGM